MASGEVTPTRVRDTPMDWHAGNFTRSHMSFIVLVDRWPITHSYLRIHGIFDFRIPLTNHLV